MLTITIPAIEYFNEETEEFFSSKEQVLQLEHSLVSISKWESKWNKPFLSKNEKSIEEIYDYIKCMTITQNVKSDTYNNLSKSNMEEINKYIDEPMTATTFSNFNQSSNNREQITSELIYFWMISFNIPMECQRWHLNRLLTLIRVCNIKNSKPTKKSQQDVVREYSSLNAARKQKYNTKG